MVVDGALKIVMHHLDHPHEAYLRSFKLRIHEPGGVNAIEIWRYRVRYPVKGKMHGFVVARCARQKVRFTLVPHPPKVIGS